MRTETPFLRKERGFVFPGTLSEIRSMKRKLLVASMVVALCMTIGCATAKSPIMAAASGGEIATVDNLLKKGANIEERDRYGYTPLMYAVYYDRYEAAKFLIEKHADVNARDASGEFPLLIAVANDNAAMVKLLLDNGADVNARNASGMIPLHYAAIHAKPEKNNNVTALLLERGADASVMDNDGQTPLKCALTYKMIDNVALIRTKYDGDASGVSLSSDDALRVPSRIAPEKGAFIIPPGKERAYENAVSDCNDLVIPFKKGLLFTTGPIGYGAGLAYDAATVPGKLLQCMEKMGFKCSSNCSK